MIRIIQCVTTLLLGATLCGAARADSTIDISEQEKTIEAVRQMFIALANDDIAQFRAVTAPDFYAFDVGKRFTGDELMQLVKEAHAAGTIFVWEVTEPQAHVDRQMAWMTWVNRGSIENAAGKKTLTWLESAVLHKSDGAWRIHFLHSTRATPE